MELVQTLILLPTYLVVILPPAGFLVGGLFVLASSKVNPRGSHGTSPVAYVAAASWAAYGVFEMFSGSIFGSESELRPIVSFAASAFLWAASAYAIAVLWTAKNASAVDAA